MTAEQDRLKSALDERSKLTASYRRSKRAQFGRAYEAEPMLEAFAAAIKRYGADDAAELISFVQANNMSWLRNTSADTRALALEIVSTRIRQIRERTGLPPFSDPMPDQDDDVFRIVRGILT